MKVDRLEQKIRKDIRSLQDHNRKRVRYYSISLEDLILIINTKNRLDLIGHTSTFRTRRRL